MADDDSIGNDVICNDNAGCGYRKGTTLDSHGSKRWRKILLAIWPHPTSEEVQNENKSRETIIKHLTAPMVGYVEAVVCCCCSLQDRGLQHT